MHDTLQKIIAQKELEVAKLKEIIHKNPDGELSQFMRGKLGNRKIKSFKKALSQPQAIIAEIKRSSPAKGELAKIADPVALAQKYQQAGAAAISVLTDEMFFNGSINDLQQVSLALQNTDCAILRKEFIIDEIQIAQAVQYGADAVLLIMAVTEDKTQELIDFAHYLEMEVLLEVHTEDELEQALDTNAKIIGVNNRDLRTLEVDINTSFNLIEFMPKTVIAVAESGIQDFKTAHDLFDVGYDALLVGEALVKAKDPEKLIRAMRGIDENSR
ncbi:MAG: indole-3-glycerol phosphate synthase TrpC [Gammaproteobacteria bacterium]|jgi:indole-3-glycerol phosphate synthase